MPSLRQMRKRIGAVRSIRQITRAMKMMAAARLRRAQEAILAARPYARRLEEALADIAARADVSGVQLLKPSGGDKIILVVVTADKGLCGSFNTNILRAAHRFLAARQDRPVELVTVGRKARDHFSRRGKTIRRSFVDLFKKLSFSQAQGLRDEIVDPYLTGEVGEVHLVYNEFKSVIAQRVALRQLLPVAPAAVAGRRQAVDFEYEPDAPSVFAALLPQYFAIEFWTAFLESHSAEMGARMTSMDSATRNANDMISRLTLVTNRIRQAGITKEIAEIVGGAEALK